MSNRPLAQIIEELFICVLLCVFAPTLWERQGRMRELLNNIFSNNQGFMQEA